MGSMNPPRIEEPTAANASADVTEGLPGASQLDTDLPWQTLTRITIGLTLLIAMAEISRLSGSMLDTAGQAWSFNELAGIGSWSARAGWLADFGDARSDRKAFFIAYVTADLAFILVYATGIYPYVRRRFEGRALRTGLALLLILIGADLVEDVLMLVTLAFDPHSTGLVRLSWLLVVLNTVKSLAAIAVAFVVIRRALRSQGRTVRESVKLVLQLIRQHRFTVVPLAVLAVVSITPGAEILDQVPDITRRWTDGPRTLALEGGLALSALLLFAVALFVIGRMRTAVAARVWNGSVQLPDAPLLPWFLVPVVIFMVGVVVRLLGIAVGLGRLGLVCVVPIVIAAYSCYLRKINEKPKAKGEPLIVPREPIKWVQGADISLITRTGDAIAVGLLVAAAVAAVRAMLPVVLLGLTRKIDVNRYAVIVLLVAMTAIAVTWWLASRVLVWLRAAAGPENGRLHWLMPIPGEQEPALLGRPPVALLLASLGLYLLLGTVPTTAGRGGVLFAFDLALLALTGIVAGLALVAHRRTPLEAFQRLHLHSTPMLSLVFVLMVIAPFVPATVPIHQVRSIPADRPESPEDNRIDLQTTIYNWAVDRSTAPGSNSCRRVVTIDGRTAELMPMLLVASEGGGIRAAEWTVQAMQRIASEPCSQHAVAFSSGVSGGAVGLALLRFNSHPDRVATAISSSRALSYGLIGLLVRDLTYAATGIPLPALDHETGASWVDRSALMEDAWDAAAPKEAPTTWQGLQFVAPTLEKEYSRQSITGPLILNSMSVGNACRVWVSEIKLISETSKTQSSSDGRLDCNHAGTPGLRSVDLISRYGALRLGRIRRGWKEPLPVRLDRVDGGDALRPLSLRNTIWACG
jgi:hypothetical protein